MIAASPAMKQVLAVRTAVAQSGGVHHSAGRRKRYAGKDVLAQFLHFYGRRHEGPFVGTQLRRLFQNVTGERTIRLREGSLYDARTPKAGILEIASTGTIFLDEIGEMPLTVQRQIYCVCWKSKTSDGWEACGIFRWTCAW